MGQFDAAADIPAHKSPPKKRARKKKGPVAREEGASLTFRLTPSRYCHL